MPLHNEKTEENGR